MRLWTIHALAYVLDAACWCSSAFFALHSQPSTYSHVLEHIANSQ